MVRFTQKNYTTNYIFDIINYILHINKKFTIISFI